MSLSFGKQKIRGKPTSWIGEMASVTSMIADGMTKDSLKAGEQITVISFPSKNPGSAIFDQNKTRAMHRVVVDNSRTPNLRLP